MPYNNEYNRGIARVLNNGNNRYAKLYAYSPVDGQSGMSGGSSAGVLFQMGNASKRDAEDNIVNDNVADSLPAVYYYGNDAESGAPVGGSGFAEGTFRDTGVGHQLGAGATGVYDKSGSGYSGGNLWTDLYSGFEDLGSDIGKAVDYVIGSGKDDNTKAKVLGRLLGHAMKMKGMGMSGGSWWDSLKSGVSDVVSFVPDLILHGLGKEERIVGGAILGNHDPYPVQGNSNRLAGKGKISKKEKDALKSVLEKHSEVPTLKGLAGKGKISKKEKDALKSVLEKHSEVPKKARGRPKKTQLVDSNNTLLAMPAPVALPNGVPPRAQLRGSYGGGKPKSKSNSDKKLKEKVMKALKGGKNLSGMTDKRSELKTGGADGRKRRAELVKKIMKEKGMKMVEASKYIKEKGLYK
jgi:hypothetical protein